MQKLPMDMSGLQVIKALSKVGFKPIRQRGSHVVLEKIEGTERWGCVVTMHRELKIGTLKSILKQARLSVSA